MGKKNKRGTCSAYFCFQFACSTRFLSEPQTVLQVPEGCSLWMSTIILACSQLNSSLFSLTSKNRPPFQLPHSACDPSLLPVTWLVSHSWRPSSIMLSPSYSCYIHLFFFFLNYFTVPCLPCSMQNLQFGLWNLVPWLWMESGPPALGAQSLSHWTTREFPIHLF